METALPAIIEAEATEITTGREHIGDRQLVEMWAARSSSPNTSRVYLRQAARILGFLEARGLDLTAAHVGDIHRERVAKTTPGQNPATQWGDPDAYDNPRRDQGSSAPSRPRNGWCQR